MTDLLPAHDIAAEESLLGLTISFPDKCGAALLTVDPDDWWHWRHQVLASVVTRMLRSGQSVDPTTVLGQLTAQGLLSKIDGPILITMIQHAWRVESAMQLAQRIRELSGRRKLAAAATRLTQRLETGWSNGDELDVHDAVAEIRHACDDAERIAEDKTAATPTNITDFLAGPDEHDWLVPGLLERTDRIVLTGEEGQGKALALDTPVPTPKGWTTMGALSVGDTVFHADGTPVRVIGATEIMQDRPCYRVKFSDGAQIVADAQHLWSTDTLQSREADAKTRRRGPLKPRGTDQSHKRRHFAAVRTTQDIAGTVKARGGHALNHSIRVAAPLQYPAQELLIHPYALGAWLGDGSSWHAALTCDDPQIVEELRACGEPVTHRSGISYGISRGTKRGVRADTFQARLRTLGVLRNKHIPDTYLRGSVDQRLALLQGLMDTDGTVFGTPGTGRHCGVQCAFEVTSKALADGALELVLSLGIKAVMREGAAKLYGREVSRRYRIRFQTDLPVFRLERKSARMQPIRTERSRLRYITSVERIESVPVRCIQIDREDGLFVVGRECIVTHNSVLCAQIATTLAGGVHPFSGDPLGSGNHGIRVLVVDCENSQMQCRRRFRRVVDRVDTVRYEHGMDPMWWAESMFVEIRPAGIDLLSVRDTAWLEHAISVTAPDLLVLGPLYKLHHLDANDETAARELVWVLDGLRERHGFALLTEAHAGHGSSVGGQRATRPIGSSLFRRWPEFGFGLRRAADDKGLHRAKLVDVVPWRGSREDRRWPEQLEHSKTKLPWMPTPEYHDLPEPDSF